MISLGLEWIVFLENVQNSEKCVHYFLHLAKFPQPKFLSLYKILRNPLQSFKRKLDQKYVWTFANLFRKSSLLAVKSLAERGLQLETVWALKNVLFGFCSTAQKVISLSPYLVLGTVPGTGEMTVKKQTIIPALMEYML